MSLTSIISLKLFPELLDPQLKKTQMKRYIWNAYNKLAEKSKISEQ